jgi:hypothetical protein
MKNNNTTFLDTHNYTAQGLLRWGQRQVIDSAQSSYYDHTFYEVPFTGFADVQAMRSVLAKRYPNTGNYFGGYTTVGDISLMNNQSVKVELVHHIGN